MNANQPTELGYRSNFPKILQQIGLTALLKKSHISPTYAPLINVG